MKKAMLAVISALAGATAGVCVAGKSSKEAIGKGKEMADKHLALFLLMNKWVKLKQDGKDLVSYFDKRGFRKIAIYGMSYVGETLLKELEGTDVEVVYGIDKNANGIYADIEIVSIEEKLEKVDAIIVTAITFFDEIEKKLSEKMDCPIVSLEDILYEI